MALWGRDWSGILTHAHTRTRCAPTHSLRRRNYPVYDYAWDSKVTGPEAYVNYKAPIHILTGAAGCPENQDGWQKTANAFSALRVNDYGYSRLQVLNGTHMKLEYVDNVVGKVLDTVMIVKDKAGPAFP